MGFQANPIKFGTDGWRGVIAADFTMERVAKLAPLCAKVLQEDNPHGKLMVVGFDRRFFGGRFCVGSFSSVTGVWLRCIVGG